MTASGPDPARGSPRLEWLPPLLVGASAALAAEVALGVLLYGGSGFMRSLTTILATQGLALASGLWSAPRVGPDLVERLRRRWLFALMAFLVATTFGASWSLVPILGEDPVGQGVGLAVLAALPLYAAGTVLGGMGAAAETDAAGRLSSPAAPAVAGGALGFVLTAVLLPLAPMPGSLLVACLVMLSAAGMLYGDVLNFRTELEVKARRSTPTGEVRVEERRLPADDLSVRRLIDHGHVRLSHRIGEEPARPWDVEVWRTHMPHLGRAVRVLVVGGGASFAPHAILREHPLSAVDVLERTPAVVELGREYFGTGLAITTDVRLSVRVGNLDDLVASAGPGYDLIFVDTSAIATAGGSAGLSTSSIERIQGLLTPDGSVHWGAAGVSTSVAIASNSVVGAS